MVTHIMVIIIAVIINVIINLICLSSFMSKAKLCLIFHNLKDNKCLKIYRGSLYHCYCQKRWLEKNSIIYKFDYRFIFPYV